MSLGVYSVTTKLLKTWRSAHTYSYNVRGSLWTLSEVHHTSAFASKRGTSARCSQAAAAGTAPGKLASAPSNDGRALLAGEACLCAL